MNILLLQQVRGNEALLIEEMSRYKKQFEAVRDAKTHELDTFWLRKVGLLQGACTSQFSYTSIVPILQTGKAVLAVVMTVKDGEAPQFWRGMNLEVSMPTGLCSNNAG